MGSIRIVAVWGAFREQHGGHDGDGERPHPTVQSVPGPAEQHRTDATNKAGVRALRETYPDCIGDSHTLLILSIVATQLQAGTEHRAFRVLPDRLG